VFSSVKGKELPSTPFFGWASFGRYPILDEDLFTEMFFRDTLTEVNFLQALRDEKDLCILDLKVPISESLIVDINSVGVANSLLVENPTPDVLRNSVFDVAYCMFPSIRFSMLARLGVMSFVGEESTFASNGKRYLCRNFVPKKGELVTPEMVEDESYYKQSKMSIWTIRFRDFLNDSVYDLTWPVGCPFSGLSVVEF
jgi:hypothetical protein